MSKPKNREEFRNQMAETFINILSEKGLEWKKEWSGVANMNAVTKAPYRGINALNLYLTSKIRGYEDVRWATMLQIMDKDKKYHPNEKWHLKAGSKATYVEYWYQYDTVNKKAVSWDQYRAEILSGTPPENFRLCTRYTPVFNASDIEGIPKLEVKANPEINVDEVVTKLSENMKVPIFYDGGDRAYYSPSADEIHLPKKEYFTNEYAFNATALHELSHATGHTARLNRALGGFFGSESYAYEELVAEMCACFMGVDLSSAPQTENHKAYVQSWIREIKEKPDTLIRAVKDAQAAALYMDFNAELISREEYISKTNGVFEFSATKEARSAEKDAEQIRVNLEKSQSAIDGQKLKTIYEYETSIEQNIDDRLVIQDPLNGNLDFRSGITQQKIDEVYNKYREYLHFKEQVEDTLNGKDTVSTHLKVSEHTPQILLDLGLSDKPLLITSLHTKTALGKKVRRRNTHYISKEVFENLPQLIENPAIVIESTKQGSIVLFVNAGDINKNPVICSIKADGKGFYNTVEIDANIVTSVYGKDSNLVGFLEKAVNENRLLFWDKKMSQTLFNIPGLQLPDNINKLDSNVIIRKFSDVVKENINKKDAKPSYDKQILKEIPIADVAEALGIQVVRRNGSAWCKIRDEKTPSCKLYETTNSFCDFGSMAAGDTIRFVAEITKTDDARAIGTLAELFNIQPKNAVDKRTFGLSNSQFAKIGIAGEMATMNMDIDLEKMDIDEARKLTEPYRITMNELRKQHPERYVEIMRTRAIPYIYSERQKYYSSIWAQDMLSKELKVDLKLSPGTNGEFRLKATELNNKEKIMLSALKGTDIGYKPRKYDFEADIDKIRAGKIQFEIGNVRYNALKRSETALQNSLDYKSVSVERFLLSKPWLEKIDYAAFVKGDSVNLAFRKSDSRVIEEAIKTQEQDKDKQKNIKR